jgi:phosphatidylserine decarboxylase
MFQYRTSIIQLAYANCSNDFFPRSEAEFESLSEYRTISQFFRRRLKPGMRPIDEDSPLGETFVRSLLQYKKHNGRLCQ